MRGRLDTGKAQRLAILRRDAEQKFIAPLETHGWITTITESPVGEFLLIKAEKGDHTHTAALLYTSATDNHVYCLAATQAEHIFFNGEPYRVESFAYGLDKPVGPARDFHSLLLKWNADSADGKFALTSLDDEIDEPEPAAQRLLLSENPIDAIWLRLRQLQSVTLAKSMIAGRARRGGAEIDEVALQSKAEGVAFALRNATDYFQSVPTGNLSQRVLNLYYGSLAFAFAEMLAAPQGARTLAEIESLTKQGHGLYTVDGADDGLGSLVVGIIGSGFFPRWLKSMGASEVKVADHKARNYEGLDKLPIESWLTVEQLFSRIPEVGDLYENIFSSKPGWATPHFDQGANQAFSLVPAKPKIERSYVTFIDNSARLTKEDIASFPGPISEIAEVRSEKGGRRFRAAIDYAGKSVWWEALDLHYSPFVRGAAILPIFGKVRSYRAICVVLLYALSIIVRYRPSVWRRVQEGDLDHMRVLIEAFLAVVERVLPEQFLETITGQRVFAKQPGALY